MEFRWHADDGPLIVVFHSSLLNVKNRQKKSKKKPKKNKKTSVLDALLQNLSYDTIIVLKSYFWREKVWVLPENL